MSQLSSTNQKNTGNTPPGNPAPPPAYAARPSNYNATQSGYPAGSYQPTGIPSRPGAQYQAGNTIVLIQQPVSASAPLRQSFAGHIIFSCFATWCCFWPLGLVAFILAMVAQSRAPSNDAEARKLGIASYVLSSLAVVAGVIIIIVAAALLSKSSGTYSYRSYGYPG